MSLKVLQLNPYPSQFYLIIHEEICIEVFYYTFIMYLPTDITTSPELSF